jgi:hypothetical protein
MVATIRQELGSMPAVSSASAWQKTQGEGFRFVWSLSHGHAGLRRITLAE